MPGYSRTLSSRSDARTALLNRARPGMLLGFVVTVAGYCWFAAAGGTDAGPVPLLVTAAGFAISLAAFLCYDAAHADSEPDDGSRRAGGARHGGGAPDALLLLGSGGHGVVGTEFLADPADEDSADGADPPPFHNGWSRRFDSDSGFFFGPN